MFQQRLEGVAQSVEQRTFNPLVLGSSPSALTSVLCRKSSLGNGLTPTNPE